MVLIVFATVQDDAVCDVKNPLWRKTRSSHMPPNVSPSLWVFFHEKPRKLLRTRPFTEKRAARQATERIGSKPSSQVRWESIYRSSLDKKRQKTLYWPPRAHEPRFPTKFVYPFPFLAKMTTFNPILVTLLKLSFQNQPFNRFYKSL